MRGERKRVGDLVDGVLRRWNLERRTREQRAVLLWPQLVGAEIARNSEATAVRDRVLLVSASSHAWAQTLDLMKADILKRLRERLGEDLVRDIHFSGGRRSTPRRRPPRAAAKPEAAVTEADRAEAERVSAGLSDPDLRECAARAFASLREARRRFEGQGYVLCLGCGTVFRGKGTHCAGCRGRRPRAR